MARKLPPIYGKGEIFVRVFYTCFLVPLSSRLIIIATNHNNNNLGCNLGYNTTMAAVLEESDIEEVDDVVWPEPDAYDDDEENRPPTAGADNPKAKLTLDEARRQKLYVIDTNLLLDQKWYIDKDVFMAGIQDPGEVDPKSGEQKLIHYPKMKVMVGKMFQKLKQEGFPNLPSNVTRVSPVIINAITVRRKFVPVGSVYREFRSHSADGSSLWIIGNSQRFYGYNQILSEIHYFFQETKRKKQRDRTPSDAIRVAAIMLDPANLKAVTVMLTGSRMTRAASDQAVDPNLAWAMDAATQFNDDDYEVPEPHHDIDPEDIVDIDPNAPRSEDRDAKWFLETWRSYLKKKYKDAIRKWDTETGGGSHEPHQFSNFCNRDRWLVWVYMMDRASNFLLFHIAKGQPPEHVGSESGSDICDAILNDEGYIANGINDYDVDVATPCRPVTLFVKRKRSAIDSCKKEFLTHQAYIREFLETQTKINKEASSDIFVQAIDAHKKMKAFEEAIASMSPRKKKVMLKASRKELKRVHQKIWEDTQNAKLAAKETGAPCDSDSDTDDE